MNAAELFTSLGETVGMTLISTLLAYLAGFPLGVILNVSSKNGLKTNKVLNTVLGIFINIMRSVPCLLLIVILMPMTRSLFGTGSGHWYTMIAPLFFASFAYVARMVETSFSEVDGGVIEMSKSMGASDYQIITKVMIREALPSLLMGLAVSMITILGYTAFAYDLGAGGLIADAYAFYTRHTGDYARYPNVWVITALIVAVVQLIQEGGLLLSKKLDKRRKAK